MKKILVTGGAGYIGSHTVVELVEQGFEVVVFDNLTTGHAAAVQGAELVVGDLRNKEDLANLFRKYDFDAVVHFAALSQVEQSTRQPDVYYRNNLYGSLQLLESMRENQVGKMVFSSTAAVYGQPECLPISECALCKPENPYGASKRSVEELLNWMEKAYGIRSVILRYFNAAGAHPDYELGEDHRPESHLIPIVLETILKERPILSVFGSDYDTHDGTCVRDYIHVCDLASAHCLALSHLNDGGTSRILNLGNGTGFSVMDIIKVAESVTGQRVLYQFEQRRAGEPAELIASNLEAQRVLNWKPRYSDIESIIRTAWEWKQRFPGGYDN